MSTLPPPPSGQANLETTEPGMCFRHPRREAGRRCTRCGRWACTECLVQANVGSHCVECAKAAKPDVKTRAKYWSARQMTLVTFTFMGLNALVFLYVAALDPDSIMSRNVTKGQIELGLSKDIIDRGIPPVQLLDGSVYSADPGQWYRIVTSGFLHFGIIHLAFNMYLLYLLGQMLEPAIGRIRFALVYIAALLGGSAGAMLLEPDGLHGGASGAVFGLMTAAFVGYMLRGVNPLTTGIGTTLLLNVVITFSIPGISKGGHIGGAVAGALCGLVVLAPGYKRYPEWMSYAVPVAVAVISVVGTVYTIQN
jgi:membrane associated rhomboid family serine protease